MTVPRSVLASLAHGPFGCQGSYLVLFAPPGKPFVQFSLYNMTAYPEVYSSVSTCGTETNAKHVFDQITLGSLPNPNRPVPNVPRIGDDARLVSFAIASGRVDVVYWRAGQDLGIVGVDGPPDDTRITPAVAEELAKRAVGSS